MFIHIIFGIETSNHILEFDNIGFLLVRDVLDRIYEMYDFRSYILKLYSHGGIFLHENEYIEQARTYRVRRYPYHDNRLMKSRQDMDSTIKH